MAGLDGYVGYVQLHCRRCVCGIGPVYGGLCYVQLFQAEQRSGCGGRGECVRRCGVGWGAGADRMTAAPVACLGREPVQASLAVQSGPHLGLIQFQLVQCQIASQQIHVMDGCADGVCLEEGMVMLVPQIRSGQVNGAVQADFRGVFLADKMQVEFGRQ